MVTHGLPDMLTLSPLACGPHASGVHIRQTTSAHVTNTGCNILRDYNNVHVCMYCFRLLSGNQISLVTYEQMRQFPGLIRM